MSEPRSAEDDSTRAPREEGSVTAEYAVLLPAAVLVLVAALTAGAALWQQIRLEEAAGAAVRQVARGETPEVASATVSRLAGGEARSSTARQDGWVSVTVTHLPPGPLSWWGGWVQEATAHAPDQWMVEP